MVAVAQRERNRGWRKGEPCWAGDLGWLGLHSCTSYSTVRYLRPKLLLITTKAEMNGHNLTVNYSFEKSLCASLLNVHIQ